MDIGMTTISPITLGWDTAVHDNPYNPPEGVAMFLSSGNSTSSPGSGSGNDSGAVHMDHICLSMGDDGTHLKTSYEVFIYSSSLFVILGLIGNALSIMVSYANYRKLAPNSLIHLCLNQ